MFTNFKLSFFPFIFLLKKKKIYLILQHKSNLIGVISKKKTPKKLENLQNLILPRPTYRIPVGTKG